MRSGTEVTRAGRVPLRHSFAFRLGVAFALVAVVGAGGTALAVNAAFASRFDRYLVQQQAGQVDRLGEVLSRAYAGDARWNREALAAAVPVVGQGDLRIIGMHGEDVWRWDGHSMSWDDRWMDGASHRRERDQTPTGDHDGGWNEGDGTSGTEPSHGSDHTSQEPSEDPDRWGSHDDWYDGDSFDHRSEEMVQPLRMFATSVSAAPRQAGSASSSLGEVQRIEIVVDGEAVGTALVRLPEPTALPDALAFRTEVIRLLLLGGLVGALLSLALGILLARRTTRPIRDVTGAAHALASGDRSVRLEGDRLDEFGEMGRAFNSMADAIDDGERLRRTFAGEVAHELRTPLTILGTQVEGLRVGVLEPTSETLRSLDDEVRRMSRLVADLQVLGSADAAAFSLDRTTVDLRELVEGEVRKFSGLFEGSEVQVETRLEPVDGWLDRVRVGQIVSNLLSNALKFTPPGGVVRVGLSAEGEHVVIRVTDSGPGIPEDELPRVFDRFFRGRNATQSGSGIGLTVVRELVEAHGGSAEVSSAAGAGATFTVRLPGRSAAPRELEAATASRVFS